MRRDPKLTEAMVAAILVYLSELDEDFQRAVARVAASVVEDEIGAAAELIGVADIDADSIVQEWLAMLPTRIRGINQTTANQIKALLMESFNNGESVSVAASRISEYFSQIDKARALLIARTEVLGAVNFAAWKVFSLSNVPFKRWLATMDDRVRDSHAEANGQLRPVDEPFDIGASSMMYPGDPNGEAKEVINCRCFVVPEMNSRTSIWTMGRARAIWTRYIRRAFAWEDHMQHAVRDVFHKQHTDIINLLLRAT